MKVPLYRTKFANKNLLRNMANPSYDCATLTNTQPNDMPPTSPFWNFLLHKISLLPILLKPILAMLTIGAELLHHKVLGMYEDCGENEQKYLDNCYD